MERGTKMAKFRLTIGENLTSWGKQTVLFEKEANNGIEFIKQCFAELTETLGYETASIIINRCWFDAGSDTIAIGVKNIIWQD